MRFTEAELLRSEIGTVEQFLAVTPAGAVLVRKSWESRLRVLHERLSEALAQPQGHPLSVAFRGAPVEGSRSIDAAFAGKALEAFVEATDTVAASLVHGGLGDRGPLRGAGGRSLRIVATAPGSFGFELELPPPEVGVPELPGLFPAEGRDAYVAAVTTTLELLEQASRNNEESVSDLVAEIHPRTAAKVRAFAEVLAKHSALFAAAFEGRQVRLDRADDVQRVVSSLAEADLSEQIEEHAGTLLGVLPESRRFEARLASGAVIQGKVERSVPDLSEFKTTWENRSAILRLRVIRVRSRTRYVLMGAEDGGEQATTEPAP